MRILQTADFHLKPGTPERIDILESLISQASENNCDAMIICGDLFEDKISANKLRPDIRMLFETYSQLKIYLLPGNHDVDVYSQGYSYGKNVELINKWPFKFKECDGWFIVMIPYVSEGSFKQALHKVNFPPQKTIIFSHGTLYDERFSFIYEDLGDFAKYMPIYSWNIENKARYIGLGHFHSKMIKTKFKDTIVTYTGAPVAVGSKCIGERKYFRIELNQNGELEVDKCSIKNSYYWKEVDIHISPGKEKKALEEIRNSLDKLKDTNVMLNLKLTGFISYQEEDFILSLEGLRNEYGSFFNNIKIENLTSNWGEMILNPAIKNFIHSLENYSVEEKVKDKALEFALEAISKYEN